MSSLFERIGGRPAVTAAVDIFYDKVLADDRLKRFFTNTDMPAQRGKQVLFLTYAFGGAPNYPGENLRKAHEAYVKAGITDMHFDAVVENLAATLKELNVSDDCIQEVATIAETTRNDILGR